MQSKTIRGPRNIHISRVETSRGARFNGLPLEREQQHGLDFAPPRGVVVGHGSGNGGKLRGRALEKS